MRGKWVSVGLKQPQQCFDIGCPLAGVGTGFVLGSGDPRTAQIALMLEAPGREELIYDVDDVELARRRHAFSYLDDTFLQRGQPVVGKAGATLWQWGLAPVQITRESVFVDNGLRCLPPKVGNQQYPTGDVRKRAEACCRQWDRWGEFGASVALVNIHPAAINRDVTPLPLMIKVFEKAKDLAAQGEKPLVLCGGKAVKLWLGYAENVTRWCGHWQKESNGVIALREKRRVHGMGITVVKEKKVKKLKPVDVLRQIVKAAIPFHFEDGSKDGFLGMEVTVRWTQEEFEALKALVAPKVKKNVVE